MEDRRTISGALVEMVYLIVIGALAIKQSLPPNWIGGLLGAYAVSRGYITINKQNVRLAASLAGIDPSELGSGTSQRMRAVRPKDIDPTGGASSTAITRQIPTTRIPDERVDEPWAQNQPKKPPRNYRHRMLSIARKINGSFRIAVPAAMMLYAVTRMRS